MDIRYELLTGRWRLQNWTSKKITHDPEEDRSMMHSADEAFEFEHQITTYPIWELWHKSYIYQLAFLQSFKNEEEMKQFEINFTTEMPHPAFTGRNVIITNNTTGAIIEPGVWSIDTYNNNYIELSLTNGPDVGIRLYVKVLSDRQLLLKELLEVHEMESHTHDIILEKI